MSDVNITCNVVDKGIETKNDDAYLVDMVVITNTWQEGRTNNTVRAVIRGDVVLNGKVDCYSITFEPGSHLTINVGARLRVWEGGITNDDCETVNYLTIVEDAVNDVCGEFLLHPDVVINNHPLADVVIISYSYNKGGGDFKWCKHAILSNGELNRVDAKLNGENVQSVVGYFDYNGGSWKFAGYINMEGRTIDYSLFSTPFQFYQHENNTPNTGTYFIMTGNLLVNSNFNYFIRGNTSGTFGNSFPL